MFTDQSAYAVRFEWGLHGVQSVASDASVTVIVDVLSFSTCVDIACARGAQVFPFPFRDDRAADFAREHRATLAVSRHREKLSLSPQSLQQIEAGTRLVLPSPNGAALSLGCTSPTILAGCLRNAQAVAAAAAEAGRPIAVIAAGERWPDDGLRVALEDLLGAGAIICHSSGSNSPEARAAEAAFVALQVDLGAVLDGCASGQELFERGFGDDVALASALNVSPCVPRLRNGAYITESAS